MSTTKKRERSATKSRQPSKEKHGKREWITVAEFSERSGYSVASVYYRMKLGKIKSKSGKAYNHKVTLVLWDGEKSKRRFVGDREVDRKQAVPGEKQRIFAYLKYDNGVWVEKMAQKYGVNRSRLIELLIEKARKDKIL